MELRVLEGAANTLRRCRPVMYLEFLKGNKATLQQYVTALDYVIYENGINLLCIPAELKERIPIRRGSTTAIPA